MAVRGVTDVFAHRGCTDGLVENTLEAFAEARRRGADGVELDVRLTADGALAVHHDAEVAGLGPVSELAVAALPGHVPLLADALAACEGMVVNVEIKNAPADHGYDPGQTVAALTAAAIDDAGWGDRVIVSSFQAETLVAVGAADPRLALGELWSPIVQGDLWAALDRASEAGWRAVHPFVSTVTPDLVGAAHERGLAVNVWTVNSTDDMLALVEMGVDALITDRLSDALAAARGEEVGSGA
jgi:glycerophosphoryl diester phosphodiesterase